MVIRNSVRRQSIWHHLSLFEYKTFKHYISNNPKVLNGYS